MEPDGRRGRGGLGAAGRAWDREMRSAMRSTGFPFSRSGRYLLAAASLALALAGLTSATAMAQVTAGVGGRLLPLVVRTDHGLVRGLRQHGAREFLGIPYAAPPTGANAWRPPQPFPPWQGIRAAKKPGHDCAQTGSLATGVPATSLDRKST